MKKKLNIIGKQWLLSLCLLIYTCSVSGQERLMNQLRDGEYLEYILYYKLNFIRAKGGTLTLESKKGEDNNQQIIRTRMNVNTSGLAERFYKVRDTLTSYLDYNDLRTLRFEKRINEANFHSKEGGVFTYRGDEIDVYAYKKKPKKELEEVDLTVDKQCTDMLGVIYQIRSLDLTTMKKDQPIPLLIFSGKKKYDMILKYKKDERIKAKNGTRYNCMKFVMYAVDPTQKAFTGEEAMSFWISKDAFHIPIQIDTNIKVGKLRGIIKRINTTPLTLK